MFILFLALLCHWERHLRLLLYLVITLPVARIPPVIKDGSTARYVQNLRTWYLAEVESRTHGSRPRTQKKTEANAKDSLSEGRLSRGQGQECSRPRPRTKNTGTSVLKKKGLQKMFQAISKKQNVFKNFFHAVYKF